jgi:hypothetical protein
MVLERLVGGLSVVFCVIAIIAIIAFGGLGLGLGGALLEARDRISLGARLGLGCRGLRGLSVGVYSADTAAAKEAARRIQAAYKIGDEAPAEDQKLVKEVINNESK